MLRSAGGARLIHYEAVLQRLRMNQQRAVCQMAKRDESHRRLTAAAFVAKVIRPKYLQGFTRALSRRSLQLYASAQSEGGAAAAGSKGRVVFLGTPDIAARVFNQLMVRVVNLYPHHSVHEGVALLQDASFMPHLMILRLAFAFAYE